MTGRDSESSFLSHERYPVSTFCVLVYAFRQTHPYTMSQISPHPPSLQLEAPDYGDKKIVAPAAVVINNEEKPEHLRDVEEEWLHDSEHPRNWSSGKKWMMVSIVSSVHISATTYLMQEFYAVQISLYTFITPLASSMMASALPDIGVHFNITSQTILAMTLSIFLLSFAIGPLFFAPLSEMYGRVWVSAFLTVRSMQLLK
jgi:hypothetical protein